MKNKLKYYKFLSDISSTFLKNYDFDDAINKFLKKLANKTKADRTYVFLFKDKLSLMDNTHEYCKGKVLPQIDNLQNLVTDNIQWWLKQLKLNILINISDITTLPKEANPEMISLEEQGIKSILCQPFFIKNKLVGFVGLDNVKKSQKWSKLSIEYLDIATKIITKAFEKENYKKKISEINSTLQATLEASDAGIVVIRKDGRILNHNDNFIKMWNLTMEIRSKNNNITLPIAKLTVVSPSPNEFEERITNSLQDPYKKDLFIVYRKDDSIIEISSQALYIKNEHIGRVWKCTDITKQRNYEKKLQLISRAFEKSNDAIVITDENVNIIETNTAFERITGYTNGEVLGKNPSLLQSNWHDKNFYIKIWKEIEKNGYWEGELWDRRKNGETYINKTFISKIEHECKTTNYIGISKDITQSKEYENQIKQLAYYDALTSLPNRAFFEQNLEGVIDECKRYDRRFAILFLDLDNFKYVNDTFGHLVGDKLLQNVANILKKCVRQSDIVARLGGDEFTLIIKDLKNNYDIDKIAQKIIYDVSKTMSIDSNEINVGVSIGISIYPDDTDLSVELIKKADIAMYNSKNNGKNQYTYFDDDMNQKILERYEMEQSMRESINKDEFYVEYQPFVDTKTDKINAVEALLRWQHPKVGCIMPGDFIQLAEENGMIVKLGEWVLERVCKDIKDFEKHNIKKVSINISAKQLMAIQFHERVSFYIDKYNVDTAILEFEITETVLLDTSSVVINNLQELRKMGITFALDDFGTGYSSLNYIKKFSIETIKIDRSFIASMCSNSSDMAIVNTIVYLSNELKKNIVVEGVETVEQLSYFKGFDKCQIQGNLFFKPLSLHNLKEIINSKG